MTTNMSKSRIGTVDFNNVLNHTINRGDQTITFNIENGTIIQVDAHQKAKQFYYRIQFPFKYQKPYNRDKDTSNMKVLFNSYQTLLAGGVVKSLDEFWEIFYNPKTDYHDKALHRLSYALSFNARLMYKNNRYNCSELYNLLKDKQFSAEITISPNNYRARPNKYGDNKYALDYKIICVNITSINEDSSFDEFCSSKSIDFDQFEKSVPKWKKDLSKRSKKKDEIVWRPKSVVDCISDITEKPLVHLDLDDLLSIEWE